MPSSSTIIHADGLRQFAALLAIYGLIAGTLSFSGWVFDIPRFTDWLNDDISIQPNTAVLIILASIGILAVQAGYNRFALVTGGFVALAGALNLLQYLADADFGFNHQLLFGREWGHGSTVTPGRFGPPASLSFMLIGISLVLMSVKDKHARRHIPIMVLSVVLLMMFSLLGYLFGARDFYAIPGLSAIALPSATMLFALALSLVVSLPEYQPMLLLCERSSAGSMARIILPIVVLMIPLFVWLRVKGHELGLFDVGTGRALGAAMLILGVVSLMWMALMDLRRREQREREADRRKDEFLATLAHELRNPLAPISNATALLKVVKDNPDKFEHARGMIERQTAHMVRLVDDLLDISRISSGKMELRRERIELAPLINQVLETYRPVADAANQQIISKIPQEPIYLYIDPARLSQVLGNLFSNACKFAKHGGDINLTISHYNNQVKIVVKDNGIGIPPDKLLAIFEMFSQLDQSLERSQGGLGIGLSLAKRLIELHNGSIQAFSEGINKGSEFVIHLPMAVDQTPLPKPDIENHIPNRKRILVVDDNRDSALSLAEILNLTGNETFLAHDGEEALSLAEIQQPDIILLDIGLPKLNGFNVCQRIREKPWADKTLIIALTGWGQEEDRRKSAEAGFDNHLVKPVDLNELMKLVSRHEHN